MTQVVIIHGYGVGLQPSWNVRWWQHLGFVSFLPYLEAGSTALFRWYITKKYRFLDTLNPQIQYELYRKEKRLAQHAKIHKRLHRFLLTERPHTSVCHSMGSFLLPHYIASYGLPSFVEHVVFVQADIPDTFRIPDKNVVRRLTEGSLHFFNYFCPWDPALFMSVVFNQYLPAGLVGARHIPNVFFPLFLPLNLHLSTMRSKRFAKAIVESLRETIS